MKKLIKSVASKLRFRNQLRPCVFHFQKLARKLFALFLFFFFCLQKVLNEVLKKVRGESLPVKDFSQTQRRKEKMIFYSPIGDSRNIPLVEQSVSLVA